MDRLNISPAYRATVLRISHDLETPKQKIAFLRRIIKALVAFNPQIRRVQS
jgi:hypothetical protein